MKNILFVCTGNSHRSIIAEAIINNNFNNKFKAYSAGSNPAGKVNHDVIKFLIEEYSENCTNKIGLCSYKYGKRYYRDIVSNITLKDYTPEKVHSMGLNYIKVYLKKLKSLQGKMNKSGNILDFIQETSLRTTIKDHISELKKIREKTVKYLYPKYFDDSIQKKDYYNIKKVTEEEKNTSAYYIIPNIKDKKGTFYINSINPENINTYELHTLSLQ